MEKEAYGSDIQTIIINYLSTNKLSNKRSFNLSFIDGDKIDSTTLTVSDVGVVISSLIKSGWYIHSIEKLTCYSNITIKASHHAI